MIRRAIGVVVATLLALSQAPAAGRDGAILPGSPYDPAVPTLEGVLGYSFGERLTDHASMQSYMQALSRDPTRVFQRTYGKTHQGRALRYLIVSHPENMARLEEIRSGSVTLADPRRLEPGPADRICRTHPVLVWLAGGVHGDEPSSTEALLAVAYHLAAARDEETLRMLRDVVVIIDPSQNPDGRERFIEHLRRAAGPRPRTDPQAIEHNPPWPEGRYNHYLFDMNRDWFSRTQRETRGKVEAFLEWMPQVFVDLHEMSSESTYYFAPPARPINRNIPESTRRWWGVFGLGNAGAFDRAGFDYFTQETYDTYYPGYGDSWPALHGAIGMTYEQASSRGMAIERRDGSILTLREAARHHVTAVLATLATAAAHREELLRGFLAFRKEAAAGTGAPARAWILQADPGGAAAGVAASLAGQGVEVLRAEEAFSARVRGYDAGADQTRRFPSGTLIVQAGQPAGRLAAALLEPDPELDAEFIREEAERRRLKQDSAIFDVTSWSLPLLAAARAWHSAEPLRVKTRPAGPDDIQPAGRVIDLPEGPDRAGGPYAYLLSYDGNAAAMALVSLLNLAQDAAGGVVTQSAGRPFRAEGIDYPAGSVILKTHLNPATLQEIVRKEAATFGVTFRAVSSGRTQAGPDLGSRHVVTVKPPRVAVAWGEPAMAASAGAIAWLFESQYGLNYTPIWAASIREADLTRYNVLVLPDATEAPGYSEILGASGLQKLKGWVDSGGTLVALGRACLLAAGKEAQLTTAKRIFKPVSDADRPAAGRIGSPGPPEAPSTEQAGGQTGGTGDGEPAPEPLDTVPGAMLRVSIEPTHYLAFGYASEGAVLVGSDVAFSRSRQGRNVVTFAGKERLRLAGFAWPESLEALESAAYLIEEPRGRGRVILFAYDPNFRGYLESLTRMFLNSIVFAPAFGEAGS